MKKIFLLVFVLIVVQSGLMAGDYGMTSFPVLMIENYGARMLAIAGSGVALGSDLNAVSVNPAGIAGMDRIAFSTMKLAWMFDTALYTMNAVYPLGEKGKSGVLGLSTVLFDINDFDSVIDGVSTGSCAAGDILVGVTYANNLFNYFGKKAGEKTRLDLGIGMRYARSTLAEYSASVLAFDLGLNFSFRLPALGKPDGRDTMTVGLSLRNLAIVLSDYTDGGATIVPWYLHFGFHYRLLATERHSVGILTGINKPSDNDLMLSSGAEYGYRETIYLRIGYRFLGREHETVSFGFGLNFEVSDRLAFRFDYANVDLAGFGKSDTFSLSILF